MDVNSQRKCIVGSIKKNHLRLLHWEWGLVHGNIARIQKTIIIIVSRCCQCIVLIILLDASLESSNLEFSNFSELRWLLLWLVIIIPNAFGVGDSVMVERVNVDIAPFPVFTGLPFHSNITRLLYNNPARSRSR